MRSTVYAGTGVIGLFVVLSAMGADRDQADSDPATPPVVAAPVSDVTGAASDVASTPDGVASTPDRAAGSDSQTAAAPPDPPSTGDPQVGDVVEERAQDDRRDEVQAETDADERRRRWWSRRNRYPAPTFTPEEWKPPEGPIRIALQAGHWKANEAPDELDGLRYGGTQWEGLMEWEVNLALAELTAERLEVLGYEVDILPAVVPPDYHAHLFIAIHADGAEDPAARGYRVGAPRLDYTGRAQQMVDLLRDTYGEATGLRRLPDVTRRMRNYYAFNVRRYEHSLDPRTVALILETGFLTSPTDRRVILDDPDRVADGIVEAVKAFPVTALPDESKPAELGSR